MTVDILICTMNEGIASVPLCLMEEQDGVGYVVSMQYTDEQYLKTIPDELLTRQDVVLTTLKGSGLSANRNNAIAHAKADICIIADDDVRYTNQRIVQLREAFSRYQEADVLMLQSLGPDGQLLRDYPDCSFNMHCPPKGYYPISIDLAFRRERMNDVAFDTRFGLGSQKMSGGEEGVWVETAKRMGKTVIYIPQPLAQTTEYPKSGDHIFSDKRKLFSYGALSYFVYGPSSMLRCLKFAFLQAPKQHASVFKAYVSMMKGILYIAIDGRKIDKDKVVTRDKKQKQWRI